MASHFHPTPHVPHPFLRFTLNHPQAGNWLVLALVTVGGLVLWWLNR